MKNLTTILAISIILVCSTVKAQPVTNNHINVSMENEEGETILKWKTNKEVNTSFFIIEKSTDGINYTQIGTIKASGNSVFSRSYEFIDIYKTKTPSTFRIVLVTMDGGQIASTPISNTQTNIENIAVK